ncbi:hypothetical protein [Nitrospira calida]
MIGRWLGRTIAGGDCAEEEKEKKKRRRRKEEEEKKKKKRRRRKEEEEKKKKKRRRRKEEEEKKKKRGHSTFINVSGTHVEKKARLQAQPSHCQLSPRFDREPGAAVDDVGAQASRAAGRAGMLACQQDLDVRSTEK